ncbi:hypothetical protein LL912_11080 [Niabella sp. CC-SYL272]|uniref:hypothetical protein n=1 Tax=Niabella agricola TaxID=2891571 RepID=UPI001F1C109C|nr:hypothetical protein [Niabella agricola]MCF3109324.1 hypothetical protein [Niabella agricola]
MYCKNQLVDFKRTSSFQYIKKLGSLIVQMQLFSLTGWYPFFFYREVIITGQYKRFASCSPLVGSYGRVAADYFIFLPGHFLL